MEPAPWMKQRILVIDDSEVAAQVAKVHLEAGGFEVRISRNLYEFGADLEGWAPDVVLADLNMPGLSGAEICQWVKQVAKIPVVIYSSMPADRVNLVARAAGADAWLSKDQGLDGLVALVRSILPTVT